MDSEQGASSQPDNGEGDRDAGELSYEAARDELAAVVVKLESGGLGLDESLVLWERGEELARICQRFLDGARARVEAALARADDSPAGYPAPARAGLDAGTAAPATVARRRQLPAATAAASTWKSLSDAEPVISCDSGPAARTQTTSSRSARVDLPLQPPGGGCPSVAPSPE